MSDSRNIDHRGVLAAGLRPCEWARFLHSQKRMEERYGLIMTVEEWRIMGDLCATGDRKRCRLIEHTPRHNGASYLVEMGGLWFPVGFHAVDQCVSTVLPQAHIPLMKWQRAHPGDCARAATKKQIRKVFEAMAKMGTNGAIEEAQAQGEEHPMDMTGPDTGPVDVAFLYPDGGEPEERLPTSSETVGLILSPDLRLFFGLAPSARQSIEHLVRCGMMVDSAEVARGEDPLTLQ